MPGPLLHVGAVAMCPHGGQVTIAGQNVRVLVGGQPVATVADLGLVAGCVFTAGTKPQPCVTVRWIVPASRVLVMGQPALLQPGPHLCLSAEQIPGGPPIVAVCQPRVIGQ